MKTIRDEVAAHPRSTIWLLFITLLMVILTETPLWPWAEVSLWPW